MNNCWLVAFLVLFVVVVLLFSALLRFSTVTMILFWAVLGKAKDEGGRPREVFLVVPPIYIKIKSRVSLCLPSGSERELVGEWDGRSPFACGCFGCNLLRCFHTKPESPGGPGQGQEDQGRTGA